MIEWFTKSISKTSLVPVSGSRGATGQGPGLLVSGPSRAKVRLRGVPWVVQGQKVGFQYKTPESAVQRQLVQRGRSGSVIRIRPDPNLKGARDMTGSFVWVLVRTALVCRDFCAALAEGRNTTSYSIDMAARGRSKWGEPSPAPRLLLSLIDPQSSLVDPSRDKKMY
jgi:hypothetical protein